MSYPITRAKAEKRTYGPSYRAVAFDPARCVESVRERDTRWPIFHQCSKKPGHGPDELYCKQHDPDAVKRRSDESMRRYREQQQRERPKWHAQDMLAIIRKIAEGHNDPAALCREFVKKFDALKS